MDGLFFASCRMFQCKNIYRNFEDIYTQMYNLILFTRAIHLYIHPSIHLFIILTRTKK